MKRINYKTPSFLLLGLALGSCGSSPKAPAASPVVAPPTANAEAPATTEAPMPEPVAEGPAVAVDLMAVEMAAYQAAKPVFDDQCAMCHTPPKGKKKPGKGVSHFSMGGYPFDGHHKTELGQSIRLAVAGGEGKAATMPKDDPGSIQGEELAKVLAWADAFDAAAVAGVGYHSVAPAGGHEHKAKHEHKKPKHEHKKAKHEHKKAKHEHKKAKHDHKAKKHQH